MGVLDDVFAGSNGVVSDLYSTLGGTAVVEIKTGSAVEDPTGRLIPVYDSHNVAFVPSKEPDKFDAPKEVPNKKELMEAQDVLFGSFAVGSNANLTNLFGGNVIYNGARYRVVWFNVQSVGNKPVSVDVKAVR